MNCERCKQETLASICSMFNEQRICFDCQQTESKHPKYLDAQEADLAAIRYGDYNFPGIGLPTDF